jgi:drug/metabolite transporter (DMT)-like permease
MLIAGSLWGLSAVIAKIAFDRGVAPVRMAEARVVVAVILLVAALAVWRRDLLRPPPGSWRALVGFGLFVAAVNGAYYVAIDHLSVGVAISIQYVAPVLLIAALSIRARRMPGRVLWLAALLSLGGAVLVSRAYAGLGSVSGVGLVAAVLSAITFGGYLLTADAAAARGAPPATVLVWGFVVAILAWSVAAPWWSWPWAKLAQPQVALSVLGVGVVGTLVPFFLAVGAVPVLSPAVAGIAATIEPPAAAAFAWLFLGQHLGGVQIVGGLLVVAGVVVAQLRPPVRRETIAVEPGA